MNIARFELFPLWKSKTSRSGGKIYYAIGRLLGTACRILLSFWFPFKLTFESGDPDITSYT